MQLIAQLHDEVVYEVYGPHATRAAKIISSVLQNVQLDGCGARGQLPPLPVTVACGRSWGAMEPMAIYDLAGA